MTMQTGYCFVLLLIFNSTLFSQNLADFRFQDSFDSIKMKKRWYYEITENNQYFLTSESFNGLHNKVFGANMHNATPVRFKFGQYRFFDDTHKHQVFYDEFRVGESLEEVSLYNSLPVHYEVTEELRFIEIHHK